MATTVGYLVERIYELIADGAGTARTLAASERFGRLRSSIADRTVLATLAAEKPIAEVVIGQVQPEAGVADELHDTHHYRCRISIRRMYFLGAEWDYSKRQATLVRIVDDAMRVKAVLGHPSNLLQTEEANATGIGGPSLVLVSMDVRSAEQIGDGRDRLVTVTDTYEATFQFSPDA